MAFQMKPGRAPFMQTGRGIPSPLLQPNISSGEKLQAEARAKAEAEAKAKQLAAGENKGGSADKREFSGTATVVEKGKKVERFAKTAAEIAAWRAAPKENKEKYLDKSATETVTVSDTGKDTPPTPTPPVEAPKKTFGKFWKQSTLSNLGGFNTTSGYADDNTTGGQEIIKGGYAKDEFDKTDYPGDMNHARNLKNSSQNNFETYDISEDDDLIMRYANATKAFFANRISPYDNAWDDKGNQKPGTGAARRQVFMTNILPKAKDWQAKEAAKAAAKATSDAAKAARNKPVAMQIKPKAKAPIKMKKC